MIRYACKWGDYTFIARRHECPVRDIIFVAHQLRGSGMVLGMMKDCGAREGGGAAGRTGRGETPRGASLLRIELRGNLKIYILLSLYYHQMNDIH